MIDASPSETSSSAPTTAVPVTVENFIRAETDLYFGHTATTRLGRFVPIRAPMPIESQVVIRANRDTLYTRAVFDLDAGPVTVTLPDPGARFMSAQVIDEDQYTPRVIYEPGEHRFTRQDIGTRYMMLGVRMLVDPNDPEDVAVVNQLQDAVTVMQPDGPGRFEAPQFDRTSQDEVRSALLALAGTLSDTRQAFGARGQVDPVRRLVCAASAWGGNPDRDAVYLSITPGRNDGKVVHHLQVRDVPVDGFWSVSVYNAQGYYEANPQSAYSINNLTAAREDDGSVRIQFGGCEGGVANCLPIMPGWNYMVRLYRPRDEVIDGRWAFPEARPAS